MAPTFRTRFRSAPWRLAPALAAVLLLAACGGGEDPPVATELVALGGTTVAGQVNQVAANPTVTLTDQRGNGMSGQLVTWRVTAGGGRVVNDTIRTNAAGQAASGGWTLGVNAGPQTLTATIEGLPPVTFTATAAAGPPARYVLDVPGTQTGVVGRAVPQPPATRVTDAFNNPVIGLPVAFQISSGGGQLVGETTRTTDANGRAAIDGWTLGTLVGLQRARATAQGLAASVFFEAQAVADAPVRMAAASPAQLEGVDGLAVLERPAVQVFDQYDNPVGGVTVSFAPGAQSGTVTGGTQLTDTLNGRARVGSWVLGSAPAQQLVATSPQLAGQSVAFGANVVQSLFDVDVRLIGAAPTPRIAAAIAKTVERWKRVIVGALPPVPVRQNAGSCFESRIPAIDETITNVVIFMELDSIDHGGSGNGNTLGYARNCALRTSVQPLYGYMRLDTFDLANMSDAVLDGVLTHEVGHVLGISRTYWDIRNFLVGATTDDPFYQGLAGREQFALIPGLNYGGTPVPVENTGGGGTRNTHWRTSVLSSGARRELMVGFASSDMRLSRLTVGALADLNFDVRYGGADELTFGGAALQFGAPEVGVPLGEDDRTEDVYMFDAAGNRRLVWTRQGPRRNALPPAGGDGFGTRPAASP